MSDLAAKVAGKQVEQAKAPTLDDYMRKYEPEFARALAGSMDAAKFAQDAMTAIKAVPQLQQADMRTMFGALFLAAQLNLPVGGPLAQFHLTPRKNNRAGTVEVVPIIGYGGYVQLVMNTGLYSKVSAFLVHERDVFKVGANSERGEFYDFSAGHGDRGPVVGVVAYVKLKGIDETQFVYVDAETIRSKHRPKFWDKTPWASAEDEMFKKTGVRVLQKMLPKSIKQESLAQAAQADQAVVSKLDNVPELQIADAEVVEDEPTPEASS